MPFERNIEPFEVELNRSQLEAGNHEVFYNFQFYFLLALIDMP